MRKEVFIAQVGRLLGADVASECRERLPSEAGGFLSVEQRREILLEALEQSMLVYHDTRTERLDEETAHALDGE